MRYVVYGAGAIGGLTGALLSVAGHDVMLIARGAHAEAISRHGLIVETAEGTRRVAVPVVTDPADAAIGDGDVVLLTMKSHDAVGALNALRRYVPVQTPIVCVQNGVENERVALRLFPNVYGACAVFPATHLEPGVVHQHSAPIPGLVDIGRYPYGVDDTAERFGAALRDAGFESIVREDIMRWKYRKLLSNVGNAATALFTTEGAGDIPKRATAEGEECLRAAGIDAASALEDQERKADFLQIMRPPQGSTWQSLKRGTGSIESDFFNGEIVLLGRLHGVPTPVNELLQQMAFQSATRHDEPGSLDPKDFETRLAAVSG
jgi:2-dehydropantoate 2-reductase